MISRLQNLRYKCEYHVLVREVSFIRDRLYYINQLKRNTKHSTYFLNAD